jgi:signal transduction histidine kinase
MIIASSAALSVVAYYYSLSVADTITDVASNDIRSNAATQARDLSLILSSGVDSITTNLQILSSSPSIQSANDDARILFDVSQNSTSQLTHFYMWLNQEGEVEWITNADVDAENFVGLDRSYREFFALPKTTKVPYFSDVVSSSDNIPRLYISYPIIDHRESADPEATKDSFKGVALAAIGLGNIGNLLRQSSPLELQRNDVLLLDNNGIVIYSRDAWLRGKSVYQDRDDIVQSGLMDPVLFDHLSNTLGLTNHGLPYSADFRSADGQSSTLSSEAVVVNGQRIWLVNVIAPHTLTTDVRSLFDQQNLFSAMMVVVFGTLAFGIAFFILSSNRRLSSLIHERTDELKGANASLEETNLKLAMLNGQLMAANEKLLINDKLQREFINIASHEMKTPTQAILLHSDIVRKKSRNGDQSIEAIARNAERLQRLTNSILDVTRIESQTLRLACETVSLNNLITSMISDLKMQVGESIDFAYEETEIMVWADKARLTQVMSNLLSNAVAFTKRGVIVIATTRTDEIVTISVADSGPGIDPGIMPRLFTKFATKSDRGTGLGLFIAKSIVEAHGGRIWAENNKRGGATFSLTLPTKVDDRQYQLDGLSARPSPEMPVS